MKVCRVCGRVFEKGRWRKPRRGEIARAELMGKVEYTICKDCSRPAGTFEAILQPRGRFEKEKLEKIIEREVEKRKKAGEVEEVFEKNGDYYFTSKKIARAVAKKLKEIGGEIKESRKFWKYDRERSIPLTKLTIAVHFRVKPGDIVRYRGKLYLVEKVRDGWIWTREGKKMKIKEIEVVEAERLNGIVISKNPPLVFIPKTNETLEIEERVEGEVEVIRVGERVWVRKIDKL